MLKNLLLLFCCTTLYSGVMAQGMGLEFNKKYYECENKWVVFPMAENDTTHIYGMVYLDEQAGFTFSYEGNIFIDKNNNYTSVDKLKKKSHMIYRLPQQYFDLAILPEAKRTEMGLPQEPEWLAIYRETEHEKESQLKRGYFYNHVGGSSFAIPILLKAYAKDPHMRGLEFELSYAYNAVGETQKAIEVLEKGLKHNPKDFMLLRELGYAYVQLNKVTEAEETYKEGIALATDKTQQAEMAFNMAGMYHRANDSKKFKEWAAVVKKYAEEDSVYYKHLLMLEKEMKK